MLCSEGDIMNQKTGICIILLLAAILIFGICYQKIHIAPEETELVEAETESEQSIPTGSSKSQAFTYLVKEEDGNLVVFLADGKTVYMETGIRTEDLSHELSEEARLGIPFTSERSLFDFLESYSS